MAVNTQQPDAPPARGELPLTFRLEPALKLSDDQLFLLSQLNRDLRLERTAQGELIIMPPTGGTTGERNAELTMQLRQWAKRDGTGSTFDSSTGFRLPNGALRSPNASWVSHDRLVLLSADERQRFLPLSPDFAVELRSRGDSVTALHEKMTEYLENGTQMAWLIDPEHRRVHIFREGTAVEISEQPTTVSAEPLLPGFVLDLRDVW